MTNKNKMKHSILILAIALFCLPAQAHVEKRKLHDGWHFRQGRSEIWHKATVPGTVHTDLMANHIIDDPFFRLNERSVQWIDKEDWMYETWFEPTAAELGTTNQQIVFHGLDTYADVYLNSHLLVNADNMHRTWVLPVKGILKEGRNHLEVYFHSPIKRNIPKFDALPYRHNTGPDHSDDGGIFDKAISPFARTAGFEYGWDWGPRLVTFGIWRPVELETWSQARIGDVWHRQNAVTTTKASLTSYVDAIADTDGGKATVTVSADGKAVGSKTVTLKKGVNHVAVDYDIRHPRLWWTNGLGEPYLYKFTTTLTIDRQAADSNETRVGLRSLILHNDKDKYGHNLYFELNGHPLFAKGSNMVPNDNFLIRCTDSVYHSVVKAAKDANMNMIRVWGGGIYEDDAFYRHCDEMGILVWQDFMFACMTYEADSAFLASVRQEAIDNVKRLRNHACIAVYAGNNECQDVWFGWGNKKKELDTKGYGNRVGKMQHDLFYVTLPKVVKEFDNTVSYRPSSPWAFEDTPSDGINGDDHYWGVWHGAEPFEAYFDHHVRFQSEYGFQSFPEYESVLQYAPDSTDHDIYGEAMMLHQKAGTYANHRIEEYMRRYYRMPSDFKTFLYVGQLLQGDGVKMGMEAFRRDRPLCMGSLVWQLNDCWPVASWSSRDYYGRWKALHYFTRKAYDDILVSPRVMDSKGEVEEYHAVAALPTAEAKALKPAKELKGEQVLDIKLVSDRLKPAKGTFRLQTITIDGRTVYDCKFSLNVPANDALQVMQVAVNDILGGEKPEDVIFYITYETGNKTYSNIAYAALQKDMNYRPANITRKIVPTADGYDVILTTDIFARGVFMSIKGIDNFFSDNYFDMLPHTSRTVHVSTSKDLPTFASELEIISLGDTYGEL